MKAMIFAAGLGTRLRPLTNDKPKALVPLCGITMLERVISRLKSNGFTQIVVNVHHFGEQIIEFLKANKNFGIDIAVSDERDLLLDTGGGILKAENLLNDGEPFLVHNADIFTDVDLRALYEHHLKSDADVTLLASHRNTQRYFLFNDDNRLVGWTNKKTGEFKPADIDTTAVYNELAFGGIHVISPKVFPLLQEFATDAKFSIVPFYLHYCNELKIMGYNPQPYNWFDVGKPETLTNAEAFLRQQQ